MEVSLCLFFCSYLDVVALAIPPAAFIFTKSGDCQLVLVISPLIANNMTEKEIDIQWLGQYNLDPFGYTLLDEIVGSIGSHPNRHDVWIFFLASQ